LKPRVRPALRLVRLLAALALMGAPPVHANVTGNLELQSHTTQNLGQGAGGTRSTLLMESLSLHYGGLPFGSAVAIATAGGAFSNVTSWPGTGLTSDAQVLSFDASIGFLPRRAVPLRLYGSSSVAYGTTNGTLASHGAGPSFLYGGTLSLQPGALLAGMPGLRVDASESRTSRPGHADGSDVLRRLTADSYGTIAKQRVNLSARVDSDHRDGAGDVTSWAATLNVMSAPQQTAILASEVRRSLPTLAGIDRNRLLSATSSQRWSPGFSTGVAGRLSDVGASGASGTLGDLQASVTWAPIHNGQQLSLSGSGNTGFTRTSAPASDPTLPRVEVSGDTYGAGGRAGYTRPVGPVNGGLAVGTSVNHASSSAPSCLPPPSPPSSIGCGFGNDGTTTQVDATVSVALMPLGRGQAQADYTIARAFAPLNRGGDRLENRARAFGRLVLRGASSLNGSLSYDDGVREQVDINAGRAITLRERAVTGSIGGATVLRGISLSTDARYTRGSLATDGTPFVAGNARQVRSITSGLVSASYNPRRDMGLQAQALGSWTAVDDAPGISSLGANLAFNWRIGRAHLSAQYQVFRIQQGDLAASIQHSIRTTLSRPFEF